MCQDGVGEAAAASFGCGQCVDDQFSTHVVGDRPAGQAPGGEVDDRGQVQKLPAGQWEIGDVTDVFGVDHLRGKVAAEEVRCLRGGQVRDGCAVSASQPQSGEADLAHETGDALVVDPLAILTQFGSDSRDAGGAVRALWTFRIRAPSCASAAWRAALVAAVRRQ